MSHWEIVESRPSEPARPYLLLRDGREWCSGTWAACQMQMLLDAVNGDRVTPGPADDHQRLPARRYRERHNDAARACGLDQLVVEEEG